MSFTEGEIVNGKVTGITKFGAFVTLEGGKSGLVHISEIAEVRIPAKMEGRAVGITISVSI